MRLAPVIVLRIFPRYGLAGLRIGYGAAPAEVVADLNRVREPFNVNSAAQAAARAALEDEEHVQRSRALAAEGQAQLREGLLKLGLEPVPSQANFCFVDVKVDSRKVFQELLQRGVIVRTGDIFGYPTISGLLRHSRAESLFPGSAGGSAKKIVYSILVYSIRKEKRGLKFSSPSFFGHLVLPRQPLAQTYLP